MSIIKPPKVRFILTFGGFCNIHDLKLLPTWTGQHSQSLCRGTGRIKSPAIIPPAS